VGEFFGGAGVFCCFFGIFDGLLLEFLREEFCGFFFGEEEGLFLVCGGFCWGFGFDFLGKGII
jgi:hypothetical protein